MDALYRAVDRALAGVLTGHPRLLAYDIHAVAEGPDSEGVVTVKIAPPSAAAGRRGTGRYTGEARSTNIIAASIEAYLHALNGLLGEEHWAGATEQAGNRKRAKATAGIELDTMDGRATFHEHVLVDARWLTRDVLQDEDVHGLSWARR